MMADQTVQVWNLPKGGGNGAAAIVASGPKHGAIRLPDGGDADNPGRRKSISWTIAFEPGNGGAQGATSEQRES